ncbi:hypothetical protein RM545_17085 [Zunongwangia sp. F260]|uniref:Lipoprotein SmpA/OmlA domain-containing protein n=1 Tax=Autumnicola lenta TaxID=3075593 RepID=A0ABU3CPY8_9FLAO|nr:hypothetical protein [Zunongwangia sp. F260]MDT0648405.1 hypothetical protein [Zunongwangia sp. F260]MDT0648409.1 hypothetical protein [Zunongwangia sp. F260]
MIHKSKISRLILIVFLILSCAKQIDKKFDSKKWKNWEETEANLFLRWDMRNDLIEDHKLKGLSQKEIIDLLGEPEKKFKDQFRYNLGPARKGINYGTLIFEFKNGTVVSYQIING